MRLAHVAPYGIHPYSGGLTALVSLSDLLASRGWQIEVWQLSPWSETETAGYRETLDRAGVEVVQLPVQGTWWLGKQAERAIASRAVDAVHLHSAFSPHNNRIAARLSSPYILSPHGGYLPAVLERNPVRKTLFMSLWERPMLKRAALVCALTEDEKEQVRKLGFDGDIAVVPNGVDAPPAGLDAMAFRRDIGIDDSDPLALFVGRLDMYYKGLDLLLAGLADSPRWHLALVGPDWRRDREELDRLVKEHGLEQRVSIVPPRRGVSLHEAFAAADLFVLYSRSEGQGIALFEALKHGTPALVSPAVERAVGVAAGGAGWVAPPDRLGLKLRNLLRVGETEWDAMRSGAVRLADSCSWETVGDKYEKALERVLDRP
jgi:glycosyltransferase involved in cell wall biosynthesis